MNTERRTDTEKVSNTLAAGIKATGGQGEERGEEMHVASDPGGGRALGPPLGGPASLSFPNLEWLVTNAIYGDVNGDNPEQLRRMNAAAGEFRRMGALLSDAAVRLVELSAERDKARAEADALKADLARAESFAVSHEAWEACMVSHNPAWEPGGMAEFPRLVQPLWDAALGLRDRRNRVLEVARQAGRVGSAGDLEHAWEAVRGLAGLEPDPKAEGVEAPG